WFSFFFSSRRRHTRFSRDWSSDVCSSDLHKKPAEANVPAVPAEQLPALQEPESKELGWEDVNPVDLVGLEVGYRLIPLVDRNQGGQLLARIKGVRKKLSQDLGFLIPPVHIRD